ncbi:MAG TPA: type II secretion system minor pseudopilin GspH [Fluviicoccus sp.]|nr:type II secretion system minor pseudopilin GspH [Fluviicoccus sp.]
MAPDREPPTGMQTSRGFTLIEVLLVVLLIGVVSGLVLMAASPSDPARLVVGEADRLEEAISLAQDTAVSDNIQFGLIATDEGYDFLEYDDASRQWLPSRNEAFSSYKLPEEISLTITPAENRAGGPQQNGQVPLRDNGKKDALKPQVLLLSSGESTAARLSIGADKVPPEILSLDDIGNLKRNPDEEAGNKP